MRREPRGITRSKDARIRVLHVLVGLTIGGAESLLADLLPLLDPERYEVAVCSLKGWGPIGDRLAARGVEVVALGGRGRFDLRVITRLASLIRERRFDIVHSHLFLANLVSRVTGRALRVPALISSQHDTEVWMRWYHLLAERASARLADHVTGCSGAVRDYAIERMGASAGRASILYNGIDLDRFGSPPDRMVRREKWGIPRDAPVAGVVGRLDLPKKGQDLFLEAASEVAASLPEAFFVIVGEGPSRAELERIASRGGLAERVVFDSTEHSVPEVLAAFDLAVLPSRWEGFGIVLLEAMASRKAVVASAVGGVLEIVEDGVTGLLVPPDDASALARAMHGLLCDRDRCDIMGEQGRRRVEARFSIEATGAQLERLYRSLIDSYDGGDAEITTPSRPEGETA